MKNIPTTNIQKLNSKTKGVTLAILGAILMSFDPIYIRFSGVSGFNTIFLFGLFTAISMSIVVQTSEKRSIIQVIKSDGWPLIISSLLMLGSASSFVLSIKNTSVANTFIIQGATPAVVSLLSWIILKEKTNRKTWLAIFFVVLGVIIVVNGSFGTGNWKGDLLALVSVFCVGLIFTILRKYPSVNRLALVGLGGFFMALVMFFFSEPSNFSTNTWLVMAAMGLLTAPLGRVLGMKSVRFIKASEASLTLKLQNVLAPVLAFIFFNEIPNRDSLIGGTIILVTITLYTISLIRESKTHK
ncbi:MULTISPECIES: DMT family transporter [unclassified Tenacibaculum]|uniref:DMT family transporter n=1 Tax=unclassified Tenacibaculum TaxID=2635139 RepID=UPI001F44C8EF|nr:MULTISPECIES: DMT family transporter [unclassified Tenacibaculum]MCF2876536.1 DMT family transporter [Tenacibaculum sp. Cn5-1]MCF2936557.1 DMT family transporter [Tenacibaculum sp. Cn5-34]MCG7511850.1 DMT family transporter [Tenacibaculum sp. Cn5-46]